MIVSPSCKRECNFTYLKLNTQSVFEQSAVKNIIFDLGGVILNLDINRTYQQFSRLSGKSIEQLKAHAAQTHFFDAYERGAMDDGTFRRHVKSFLEIETVDDEIDIAWNAMLLDLPTARLDLLKKVGSKFRIFLLSNTNNIHLQAFTTIVHSVIGNQPFNHYFEKAYYSHILGMRKPDKEIFQYVLQENGLNASETLFLDDSLANLQGAASMGIQTFHVLHPGLIFSLFDEA
jgi:putative hydrolase of the HAD superfamily